MQLSQWLKRANLSQKDFARLIEASPAAVSRLIHGDLQPSSKMIIKIDKVTKGEVGLKDWAKQMAKKKEEMSGPTQ